MSILHGEGDLLGCLHVATHSCGFRQREEGYMEVEPDVESPLEDLWSCRKVLERHQGLFQPVDCRAVGRAIGGAGSRSFEVFGRLVPALGPRCMMRETIGVLDE